MNRLGLKNGNRKSPVIAGRIVLADMPASGGIPTTECTV